MDQKIILATDHGIKVVQKSGDHWENSYGALINHKFTAVDQKGNAVLAGTTNGVFLSLDVGRTWREVNNGLTHRHVRAISFHPEDPNLAFVGTEPAAIFVSRDRAETWQEIPEVAQLRRKYDWYLPYSPNEGCVRAFAFQNSRGYAAVEQGGFLRSNDRGGTWHLMDPEEDDSRVDSSSPWVHPDVHSIFIHPSSKDQVFVPTGGGLYYSTAGGRSWDHLNDRYCRAVWVDPFRASHIILGTAVGPDRNGRIIESINGGETWDTRMDGLETVWEDRMVEEFIHFDDQLIALLSDGVVISAAVDSLHWQQMFGEILDVRAACVIL